MTTQPDIDEDELPRIVALQAAQWFYDRTDTVPSDPDSLLCLAATLEHYLTNGLTVSFSCPDSLRKTVRGEGK